MTRQSPRMFSTIEAAAPGWPSASVIIALLDRRLSTISTASRASHDADGSHIQPQTERPASTVSASGISTAADDQRDEHLSRLAVNENTMPICFSRSEERDLLLGLCHAASLVVAARPVDPWGPPSAARLEHHVAARPAEAPRVRRGCMLIRRRTHAPGAPSRGSRCRQRNTRHDRRTEMFGNDADLLLTIHSNT